METRIVAAVGRAHLHGSKRLFREAVIDPLVRDLQQMSRDRRLARDVRELATLTLFRLRPIAGGTISDATENDLMKLIFNATSITNLATSTGATSLFYALHKTDPLDTGNQSTNEVLTGEYASYAGVSVLRAAGAGGHTVTANSVSPQATIVFPAGTGGTGATIQNFSVGMDNTPTSKILFSGTVSPNFSVGAGVTPQLTTGTAITID